MTTTKEPREKLNVNIDPPLTDPKPSPKITPKPVVEMDLNILFKFINIYDGSRETLNSFIVNCNNVHELATDLQKPILFKYILSQLRGKAELACSIKDFNGWEQLKDFLKNQFCERKHYSHLLTELQESRQGPQETVSQYALKIETCLSQLLTEISLQGGKVKEMPGRTAAMEDLALHHFTMGILPRISTIVRSRAPKNLNEAINIAISEERIQQTMYKRSENRFSKNPNSTNSNMKPKPNREFFNRNQGQNRSDEVCRYCKHPGHSIENCRKREYNNNKAKNERPSTSGYNNKPQQRVNFVEEAEEDDSYENEYDDTKNE